MLTPQSDPARVRDAWATVLESGEVAQGTGRLRSEYEGDESRYCCLGVLCELAVEAGVVDSYDGSFGTLSADLDPVRDWAGLHDDQGSYDDLEWPGDAALTADNDGGQTFAQIAQTIRREPAGLIAGSAS